MSLSKVTYTDGETVIHADNLNQIQDQVIENLSNVSTLQTTTSTMQTTLDTKQASTDSSLSTTAKTVVGAINELRTTLNSKQDNFKFYGYGLNGTVPYTYHCIAEWTTGSSLYSTMSMLFAFQDRQNAPSNGLYYAAFHRQESYLSFGKVYNIGGYGSGNLYMYNLGLGDNGYTIRMYYGPQSAWTTNGVIPITYYINNSCISITWMGSDTSKDVNSFDSSWTLCSSCAIAK